MCQGTSHKSRFGAVALQNKHTWSNLRSDAFVEHRKIMSLITYVNWTLI